ncbi:UNVERIFIED_CONTAM: hypothetical protein FKN15_006835 [Acipenser sinensis]
MSASTLLRELFHRIQRRNSWSPECRMWSFRTNRSSVYNLERCARTCNVRLLAHMLSRVKPMWNFIFVITLLTG